MSKTVKQLLKEITIEELAIPSNIGYGNAISKRDGIEIILNTEKVVEAWVGGLSGDSKIGGGTRRHVWFYAENSVFSWHCSGNPKDHDIFCKHCVALAQHLLTND